MTVIKGIAASDGIAIGRAAWLRPREERDACHTLDEAVSAALEELDRSKLAAKASGNTESAEVLEAYTALLSDPVMLEEIREEERSGTPVLEALERVLSVYTAMFESMDDPYMRQRGEDVRNIGSILRRHLTGAQTDTLESLTGILAARELTPLDTVRLDKKKVRGFLTELGGATSHIAILAKSLGIPAVVGLTGLLERLAAFDSPPLVILDGKKGTVYLDPDPETLEQYRAIQAQWEEEKRLLAQEAHTLGQTADGTRVQICVNIGSPADIGAVPGDFDGVGLFRTEFLFSSLDHSPSFDEQYALYRQTVEQNGDRWTTFRTLDVGGDKGIPYLEVPAEENPFLGNRGLRLCLERRELFLEQLKAILAAGAGHKLKLMFPMVDTVTEFLAAKALVGEARKTLESTHTPQCQELKLGVMIETPAAALTADLLMEACDFVSLGTNDLTQYIMAADRNNSAVAPLCNACDPAVIRAIRYVADTGKQLNKPVSVCGELAGMPIFVPLLVGLGIRSLSVSPSLVLPTRHQVRQLSLNAAEALAQAVLRAKSGSDVKALLEHFKKEYNEVNRDSDGTAH